MPPSCGHTGPGLGRGCGGPAIGRPEGGGLVTPNVPPEAAPVAEPVPSPPWSDIFSDPSATGVTAREHPHLCSGQSCLLPSSHSLGITESLSGSHTDLRCASGCLRGQRGSRSGPCLLHGAGGSGVTPWERLASRHRETKTETEARDRDRDGRVSLAPVTRDPPHVAPQSQQVSVAGPRRAHAVAWLCSVAGHVL